MSVSTTALLCEAIDRRIHSRPVLANRMTANRLSRYMKNALKSKGVVVVTEKIISGDATHYNDGEDDNSNGEMASRRPLRTGTTSKLRSPSPSSPPSQPSDFVNAAKIAASKASATEDTLLTRSELDRIRKERGPIYTGEMRIDPEETKKRLIMLKETQEWVHSIAKQSENEAMRLENVENEVAEHSSKADEYFSKSYISLDMQRAQNESAKVMFGKIVGFKDALLRDVKERSLEYAEAQKENNEMKRLNEELKSERNRFADAFQSGHDQIARIRIQAEEEKKKAARELALAHQETTLTEERVTKLSTRYQELENKLEEKVLYVKHLESTFKDREMWLLTQINELEHAMRSSSEMQSSMAIRRIGRFITSVLRERRLRKQLKRSRAASLIQGAWNRHMRRTLASRVASSDMVCYDDKAGAPAGYEQQKETDSSFDRAGLTVTKPIMVQSSFKVRQDLPISGLTGSVVRVGSVTHHSAHYLGPAGTNTAYGAHGVEGKLPYDDVSQRRMQARRIMLSDTNREHYRVYHHRYSLPERKPAKTHEETRQINSGRRQVKLSIRPFDFVTATSVYSCENQGEENLGGDCDLTKSRKKKKSRKSKIYVSTNSRVLELTPDAEPQQTVNKHKNVNQRDEDDKLGSKRTGLLQTVIRIEPPQPLVDDIETKTELDETEYVCKDDNSSASESVSQESCKKDENSIKFRCRQMVNSVIQSVIDRAENTVSNDVRIIKTENQKLLQANPVEDRKKNSTNSEACRVQKFSKPSCPRQPSLELCIEGEALQTTVEEPCPSDNYEPHKHEDLPITTKQNEKTNEINTKKPIVTTREYGPEPRCHRVSTLCKCDDCIGDIEGLDPEEKIRAYFGILSNQQFKRHKKGKRSTHQSAKRPMSAPTQRSSANRAFLAIGGIKVPSVKVSVSPRIHYACKTRRHDLHLGKRVRNPQRITRSKPEVNMQCIKRTTLEFKIEPSRPKYAKSNNRYGLLRRPASATRRYRIVNDRQRTFRPKFVKLNL